MKNALQMLQELTQVGNQFRNTAIVDDDFPHYRDKFDNLLKEATELVPQLQITDSSRKSQPRNPINVKDFAIHDSLVANTYERSVLQDWVMHLGLRHQGVLLSALRGCDTAPKDDASKLFVRCLRNELLNAHCGDNKKSGSYIEYVEGDELLRRFNDLSHNLDHYPHHYLAHLLHAIEIMGYKMPLERRGYWHGFYMILCKGLHCHPETEVELDKRLNADEQTFVAQQK